MDIKTRIVNAAIELMSRDGVKSTTMDSIAHHIGISKRTIYENFKDKTQIVEAVSIAFIQEGEDRLIEVGNCEQNIIKELFIMIQELNKHYSMSHRITQDIKKFHPELFEKLFIAHQKRSFEILVQGLQRGKDQGYILEMTNLPLTAYVIIESVKSLMVDPERLMELTRIPPLESLKQVVIHCFRAIATTKGIKVIDQQMIEHKLKN
ncbi:MAG: TetR/AcrR family transcriptional regulator [Rikenellaceae bacterium]